MEISERRRSMLKKKGLQRKPLKPSEPQWTVFKPIEGGFAQFT